MAQKIARIDAENMNSLYASELTRMGVKVAAGVDDRNGAPEAPQAFKDHESYLATLKAVLNEDSKVEGGDANDVLKD